MSGKKLKVTPNVSSNTTKGSLVKVVVASDAGKWISPEKNSTHTITSAPEFPSIRFEIETNQPPPYKWRWSIKWDAKVSGLRESVKRGKSLRAYSLTGEHNGVDKYFNIPTEKILGGTLEVEVTAGVEKFRRSVFLRAENPDKADVIAFLKTIENTSGFETILEQESRFKNFIEADGHPIVAFDNGYGMTQMTNPAPTYEQVWSWKENVKGGAKLYQQKQALAKLYLSQSGRKYTEEQLKLETWSRWNGGGYHTWNSQTSSWIRNNEMLCDSKTGNIGWNTTAADNVGKSENELHDRDSGSYRNPPPVKDRKWKYTGICYADHLQKK